MNSTLRWVGALLALALLCLLGYWITRRADSDRPLPSAVSTDDRAANIGDPPRGEGIVDSRTSPPIESDVRGANDGRGIARERAPIESAALVGRILDENGSPVADAELTWTALTDDLCDLKVRLIHEGFERVWNASPAALTAADGTFALRDAPLGASDHDSVVWATHPGHEAACVLLKPGPMSRRWPGTFRMKLAACVRVHVVDASGAPVSGALVDEFLGFAAYDGNEQHDLDQKARKVFGRRIATDSSGDVCGSAASGLTVWMASKDALRAAAKWGEHFEEVTLVLVPTFHLSGRITSDLSGVDPTRATILTAASAERAGGATTWLLPRLNVRADGTFGPIACPILTREKLIVRLEDGPFLPSWIERAMPHAGDNVHVSIEAAVGKALDVSVRDPDDKPIQGALVTIGMESSPLETILARDGESGADGIAHLLCPKDRRFYVSAAREGFAYATTGLLAWAPDMKRVDLKLSKAGVIRGRCLRAGAPVTEFEVLYWTDDVYRAQALAFRDDQGRFEIKDLPQGEVTLFAVAAELPQSARRTLRVAAEPGEEIVIELPEPVTMNGRVVSGIDGKPVPTARVQSYSSHGGQVLHPRGEWKSVRADGAFELTGVGHEGAGYSVAADGYATTYGVVMPDAKEKLLLDTVVLHPLANLVVRLVGDATKDYSRYVLWTDFGERRPPATFDANGELRLEALRPATYAFFLRHPDGDVEVENFQIRPGASEPLIFDVSHGCALTVGFEPRESRARVVDGSLSIVQISRAGRETRRRVSIRTYEPLRIERLREGPATLELQDASGKVLCTTSVAIGSAPEQSFVLTIGGQERRLRIVDARGAALGGTKVELCAASGESPWRVRLEADARGELTVGPTTATKLSASLQHPNAGRAYGLAIDLSERTRDPIELVLDGQRTVDVQVVDGDAPREGVQFYFDHPSISIMLRCFWTSGPDGNMECRGFADGDYDIVVNSAGYWPTRHPVRVTAGVKPVVIRLKGLGNLRFVAKDRYGEPVAGVTIDLRSLDLGANLNDWVAAHAVPAPVLGGTDARGEWMVTGLPQGTYAWRAQSGQTDAAAGKCEVAPRSVTDIPIVLQ